MSMYGYVTVSSSAQTFALNETILENNFVDWGVSIQCVVFK